MIDNSLIEKIVYNTITNDKWLDKHFKIFKPKLDG